MSDAPTSRLSLSFPFAGFWWALLTFSTLLVSWVCDVDLAVGEHRIGCAPQEVP